ncbi:ureidoglycolate lyase [Bilifractor porci]|jgi:ureidoglycolate hydrolase|uniref:Ureidoglycolate hydrolase n=1 Tax=Bilifractor porci TaxID=2606636 RepID=A0A7X2P7N7_9FIRM|nr:ureidoglycolate lyase [Bilifractor porci]MST81769.1 Ureidoglycolate hydrolase [Bilifractor porci]
MRKIKVEPLTREAFAPFGEYYAMNEPEGFSLNGEIHRFFPDRVTESYHNRLAFSPILVKKPEKMLIKQLEYHTTTPEMILPLNGDMIIHVGPASNGIPVTGLTKAFLVKQWTLVKIKSAIWHLAPLPADVDELSAMIILPECTYINDCKVVDLKEEEQFLIEK